MSAMSVIYFEPLGLQVECRESESLFAAAQRAGVPIPTACVGRGTCGLCRVRVLEGEQRLSPMTALEKKHLGNTYFVTKLRLTCQTQVRVPSPSQATGEVTGDPKPAETPFAEAKGAAANGAEAKAPLPAIRLFIPDAVKMVKGRMLKAT
jgi:2Fe-2S ferredoxin